MAHGANAFTEQRGFTGARSGAVNSAVSLRGAYETLLPPPPRSRHHCLMQRRTRTACLAFILGTLALLARGQQSNLPELTLEQAVEQAVANNSSLKTASLETRRAADDLAANKTRRFANTQITALGAQLVTKPSVTFPAGSLGVYSATGPIPSTDKKI